MSCDNQNINTDACNLHECIDHVFGLPSNSASPSDTWILTFKDGVKYDDVPLNKGFAKIWIAPNMKYVDDFYMTIVQQEALNYEQLVYSLAVRKILESSISPHFVRFLFSGDECNGRDLAMYLTNDMTPLEATKRFNRNMANLMLGLQRRPSISDDKKLNPRIQKELKTRKITKDYIKQFSSNIDNLFMDEDLFKYNILITEAIDATTLKLEDFIYNFIEELAENHNNPPKLDKLIKEFYKILFQITQGCLAMFTVEMVHNDLHSGNVFIEHIPKTDVQYIIGQQVYIMETTHKIKIYDFDHSYVKDIGPNKMLDINLCEDAGECNTISQHRDMNRVLNNILLSLWENIHRPNISKLLEQTLNDIILIATTDNDAAREYTEMLVAAQSTGVLINPEYNQPLDANEMDDLFTDLDVLLSEFAEKAGMDILDKEDKSISKDSTFVIKEDDYYDNDYYE